MTNSTPILLDRLAQALAGHGVTLKRQQLLGVAAAAFGYRNAEVFSASAKAGEITPPSADVVGHDDQGLTVLRDPAADALFAMKTSDARSRAARWCVSPYGNLLDVSAVPPSLDKPPVDIEIHVATVSHRHGTNFYTAFTAADLDAQVAGFCEEWWSEACEHDPELPETPDDLTDAEAIEAYFAAMPDEYVETSTDRIRAPGVLPRTLRTATGEAWVICLRTSDEEEPLLWWNDKDGWGCMETATVFADSNARLPNAGEAEGVVTWQRLPGGYVEGGSEERPEQDEWERMPSTQASAEAGAILCIEKIEAAPRVVFSILNVERTRDARTSSGHRIRTLMQTGGEYDPEMARAWADEVRATLAKAGAQIEVAERYARIIFKGDADVSQATTPEDWLRAMSDLIRPLGERERIMADFTPEAWVLNHAIEVDSDEDNSIDVTYEMLLIGRDAALELGSGDTDHLLEALRAPEWIRQWSGPFTIRVHDAVEESNLFGPEK